MQQLLTLNPDRRANAESALRNRYFEQAPRAKSVRELLAGATVSQTLGFGADVSFHEFEVRAAASWRLRLNCSLFLSLLSLSLTHSLSDSLSLFAACQCSLAD